MLSQKEAQRNLVKLSTYAYPYEAHLVKGALEAQGIMAFVFDDQMNYTNWLYGAALGGVRVMVRKEDYSRAQEVLATDASLAQEEKVAEKNNAKSLAFKLFIWLIIIWMLVGEISAFISIILSLFH